MKKLFLIILILILCNSSYSQIEFEKGYFIDNVGTKTECLIKNIDWKNNPTEFHFKSLEGNNLQLLTIKEVKEFGVATNLKYVRAEVDIDRSSEIVTELSTEMRPNFNKELLFLKVLVEGKVSLYLYEDRNLRRFFYESESTGIKQLIFKTYKLRQAEIAQNNTYKQQLLNELKCESIARDKIEYVKYSEKPLTKLFIKYNECSNNDFVNYGKSKGKRDWFNLKLRPGVKIANLYLNSHFYYINKIDFGSKFNFRFGLEAEFVLPFNKNKWSVFVEPTYNYFKDTNEEKGAEIDYKSIEIPVGVRHYFFLNKNSKIFVNGAFVADYTLSSKVTVKNLPEYDPKSGQNIVFGLGYDFKDRFNIEARYQSKRALFTNYMNWSGGYTSFSIILGYNLF